MDTIDKVREIAKDAHSESLGSHDWEHTERVCALAIRIAEKEGADPFVVRLAALLHDIARSEEDESGGKIDHAEKGALAARSILGKLGVNKEIAASVFHCIETHRFRNEKQPETIEAKVLFDADKLDSIGAVGIGRAFLFAGEIGARLHNSEVDYTSTDAYTVEDTAYREYMVKLRFIKERMLTKEGLRLASERNDYMVGFFDRIEKEINGIL
jgi:uncharacterized protein